MAEGGRDKRNRVLAIMPLVVVCVIVLFVTSCPPSSLFPVDLAVVDEGLLGPSKSFFEPKVVLYLDALRGGRTQAPDVVLTRTGTGFEHPVEAVFAGADLYVLNAVLAANSIYIFRDYRDLTDDALADVVLDLPFEYGANILVENNRLIASGSPDETVIIWDDADAIPVSRPADLAIGPLSVSNETGAIHAGGDLLAINGSDGSLSNRITTLFRLVENGTKTLSAQRLATLRRPVGSSLSGPQAIGIIDNTLYANLDEDNQQGVLGVYENASSLSNGAQPDGYLDTGGSFASWQQTIVSDGRRIYARGDGVRYGLTVFDSKKPLTSGQAPAGGVGPGTSGISGFRFDQLKTAGHALFYLDFESGGIHVFRNAAKITRGQSSADFVLPAFVDFVAPVDIAAQPAPR
jgi:hypothetical protein